MALGQIICKNGKIALRGTTQFLQHYLCLWSDRMVLSMKYTVVLKYDIDLDRWYIDSSDIPGLWMESGSLDALLQRIRMTAPELIAFNCKYTGPVEITFKIDRIDKLDVVMPINLVS